MASIDPQIYKRIYQWINHKGFFKWSGNRKNLSKEIIKSKVFVCYLELYLFSFLNQNNIKLGRFNLIMLIINKLISYKVLQDDNNYFRKVLKLLIKFLVSKV